MKPLRPNPAAFLLAAVLASCAALPLPAQDAKPAVVKPQPPRPAPLAPVLLTDGQHEAQRLRLREPQLLFFAAQKDMQIDAQSFYGICAQLTVEEKWPPGTQCDINNLAIHFPPEQPSAKPPGK